MGRILRATLAALLVAVSLGCAAAPAAGPEDSEVRRDLIGEADLAPLQNLDALQAIQRLRPAWLQGRGTGTFSQRSQEAVRIYLDRVPFGGPQSLRTVPVRNLQEIRYLDSRRATLEFGTDHVGGAILLTTRGAR